MRISNLHEFWFANKDGLRIACKRWHSRGPARGRAPGCTRDGRAQVVEAFMKDALCFPTLPKSAASFLAASTRLADPGAFLRFVPICRSNCFPAARTLLGSNLKAFGP
jgi:hypothetical protein